MLLADEGAWEVTVADLAAETGLDPKAVDRALEALHGPYVAEYQRLATGGIPDLWSVTEVTSCRQARGRAMAHCRRAWPPAWPRPSARRPRRRKDPERKSRLRQLASFLGETRQGPGGRGHGEGHHAPDRRGPEVRPPVGDAPPESFRTDILRSRVRP